MTAVMVVFISLNWDMAIGQTPPPGSDDPGAQVLTRGPVHEAFAGMVTYNPEPGVVVAKVPPAAIEEMPPAARPEGDNVTWIPGYWAWDDERNDFLWISGTWRALPPGRAWMAGYWAQTPQGHQWISGYWADAAARETTYLPPPPTSVEAGPNIAAPSVDYGWSPGCWVWYQGRYAWQPGYWEQGRADWDWCPAHYVWTPRGYIFVDGFWDYPVARRGLLFAPVYFESGVYARRGYYSPTVVIDLGVFNDHLFLRPRYQHYYFGDYYAASYVQVGFYASVSFSSSRHGYDPIYSHQRWEHRQDREWERREEASYQNRRDHEAARPPRTWAAQRNLTPGTAGAAQNRLVVATTIDQLAKTKDSPMRFQPVDGAERQKLAQRGRDVQQSRDQRRTLEDKAWNTTTPKNGAALEPVKVKLPRSPIVAKPASEAGGNQTPPKAQRSPKPEIKPQPKSEPASRLRNGEPGNPQSEPRKPDSDNKSIAERSGTAVKDRAKSPESVRTPVASKAAPREQETVAARPPQIEKPVASAQETIRPARKNAEAQSKKLKPAVADPERKVEVRTEDNRSAANQEPSRSKADEDHGKNRGEQSPEGR
jgi:hypothetical protein